MEKGRNSETPQREKISQETIFHAEREVEGGDVRDSKSEEKTGPSKVNLQPAHINLQSPYLKNIGRKTFNLN